MTITRVPRVRDSATFSAYCRHTLQRMKTGSPSFHSLVVLSRKRELDATVKDATAAPLGVNRSSGSLVMLPTIVTLMSPWAMEYRLEWKVWVDVVSRTLRVRTDSGEGVRGADCGRRATGSARLRGRSSVRLRAHDLGAQHGLVQVELAVQLLHRGRVAGQVEDGVDALGLLVDLEREATTAPDVDLVDGATVVP